MKKTNYEIQLLARLVADRNEYFQNMNMIHEGLFLSHSDLFIHIRKMFEQDRIPSLENLMQVFPSKTDIVLDIVSDLDYSIPMQLILQEVHERYRNNVCDTACSKAAMKNTSDEKVSLLTDSLMQLEKNETKQVVFHAYDVARELIEKLKSGVNPGLLTDFTAFDKHTGGLQPSDLIIIAARSSQGKTSLALTIANNLLARGKKVLFVSMELSKPQLVLRVLSADMQIPVKYAHFNVEGFEHAASMLQSKHFYLADVNNTNYRNVLGIIRGARIKNNIEVVFVDYLQLMRSDDNRNREQEVGSMARAFKNLAKELNMPVVLLSQLRKYEGSNPEPKLADLRDSGQIEEAADIVWMIYRPEFYNIAEHTIIKGKDQITVSTDGKAFHNIAKGRNYGTTEFQTGFESKFARFCDTRYTEESGDDYVPQKSNSALPF